MGGNKIPSNEDFERASRYVAERNLHLARVAENVKSRFKPVSPIFETALFPDSEGDFRATIVFKKTKDIADCKSNGISTAIEDAFYEELEHYGRGKRGEINVVFEFESDENIRKIYKSFANYLR
jgi:hypothetical protein